MKNTFGVCVSVLALGIGGLVPTVTRAQSRLAAGGAGGGSESSTTSAAGSPSAPAASSATDLRQRIEALKAELAQLNSELASEASPAAASPAAEAAQEQGSAAPATPAQGSAPAAAPAAAAPMPLPSPSMTAPLSTAVPHEFSAGPFEKLEVTGILSGMGLTTTAYVPPDTPTHFDVSNAQIFVQKTTGWWQFYAQGGIYNIEAVGQQFLPSKNVTSPVAAINLYGPFPVGYLKLVKGNFNVEIGALPTLVGAEYTFSFENMNVERGLLWFQEPAISRGIQLNDTYKKLTLAFSWNDGYYSNHYNWLTGSAAWAFNASNTLTFVGGSNFNGNGGGKFATSFYQNNSMIYNLIYTYSHGNWMITPYYQYQDIKPNTTIGITEGAHMNAGALLVNYNFKHGVSLSPRVEYIKSSGSPASGEPNLIGFGPGTGAVSFTVTPTWAKDGFFVRGDFSLVHITNFPSGATSGFSPSGTSLNQPRGVIEAGFLF